MINRNETFIKERCSYFIPNSRLGSVLELKVYSGLTSLKLELVKQLVYISCLMNKIFRLIQKSENLICNLEYSLWKAYIFVFCGLTCGLCIMRYEFCTVLKIYAKVFTVMVIQRRNVSRNRQEEM